MRVVISIVFLAFLSDLVAQYGVTDSLQMSKELDQIVITAQFTPTDTRQTVNSVRVLNRKTIEQKSAINLQELLQTETNIRISQDAILGSTISINGLKGENLKILIDGVPIVGRLNGNIDAGQIPLNTIQKIEIIEGAQSLIYGSEASGGVINIITRKSQLAALETELNTQYENNGFRSLAARVGISKKKWLFQLNGNVTQFVPVTDTTTGRDQLWNPKKQNSVRGLFRFMPSERSDFRISANLLTESVDNLGEKKRIVFKPYAFDDYYFTDRFDVNVFGEHWTKSKNLIQATLGWNTFSRIKNSYRFDFDTDFNELLDGMQDTTTASGIITRLTYASEKQGKKWNYLLGLENYYERASGTRLLDTTSVTPGQAYTNDLGVFGSTKIMILEGFTLQTGARYTHNLRYGSAFTPSTWILWQPKLPFKIKSSWAYGFRSPAIKELFFSFVDVNHFVKGNPNLKPEKSLNLRTEIVINTINSGKATLNLTAAGFYNVVSNRIILTALGPVHYEYRNVDNWKSKGASFRANLNYGEWLSFQSEVITTGFHNPNDGVQAEKDAFLVSSDWSNDLSITIPGTKVNWNVWHKFTGKTPFFYNQDGTTQQGYTNSWHMLNTGFTVHFFDKKLRFYTGVKNIFNVKQLQANNNNGIHIEASNQQNLHWGRNFYVGITWQWHN